MRSIDVCVLGMACFLFGSGCSSDSASLTGGGGGGGDPTGQGGSGPVAGSAGTPLGAGGGAVAGSAGTPPGAGGGDPIGHAGSGTAGSAATGGSGGAGGNRSTGGAPQGGAAPETECGVLGGNFQCDKGLVHRPTLGSCTIRLPKDVGPTNPDTDECAKNSDCTQHPNGYCNQTSGFHGAVNICAYACATDSDCGKNEACFCETVGGVCAEAQCKTDRECSGLYCAKYDAEPSLSVPGFACQSANDECNTDADCQHKTDLFCGFQSGHRACLPPVVL